MGSNRVRLVEPNVQVAALPQSGHVVGGVASNQRVLIPAQTGGLRQLPAILALVHQRLSGALPLLRQIRLRAVPRTMALANRRVIIRKLRDEFKERPLATVACVGALGAIFWVGCKLLHRPSVRELAEATTGCMAAGNGSCVYNGILEAEREALHLDKKKVQDLLDQYVLPGIGSRSGSPKKDHDDLRDQGMAVVNWQWPTKNGQYAGFKTIAVATPDGARSICTTEWMIFSTIYAKYRKSPHQDKMQILIEGLERDKAELEKIGIMGIYTPKTGQVTGWDALLTRYKDQNPAFSGQGRS